MRGDQPQVACAWTAVERSRAKRRARLTCWSRVAHKYRGDLGLDTGGVQPRRRGMARLLQRDRDKPRLLPPRPREREHRSEGSLDRAPPRAIQSSGQPSTAETAAKPIRP